MIAVPFALAALSLPMRARADEGRGWSLWTAGEWVAADPTGDFHPIGEGSAQGFGIHLTLSRPGSSLAFRLDFLVIGTSRSYDDTTATYTNGTPLPFESVEVTVGNDVTCATLGVQWDPHPDRSGFYAFATAGGAFMGASANPPPDDNIVVPDLPQFSIDNSTFCAIAGIGSRLTFGNGRHHDFHLEVEYLQAGASDYIGEPASHSDVGHTQFPIDRANVAGWVGRIGYAYRFHWGEKSR